MSDNISAFPRSNGMAGMSLRDWFAGHALAGMLAYPGDNNMGSCHNNATPTQVAASAYIYADAMLAARKAGAA